MMQAEARLGSSSGSSPIQGVSGTQTIQRRTLFGREDFSGQWAPDLLAWLGNVAAHGAEVATMDRIRGARCLPQKVLVALAISRYRPWQGIRGEAVSRLVLRGAKAVLGSGSWWPRMLARMIRESSPADA